MEINGNGPYGIDLLDDDDDDVIEQVSNPTNKEEEEEEVQYVAEPSSEPSSDLMSDFLKTRGIDDASKIKFEDDNGEIIERNWNDLTREEQLNILNTPLDVPQQQIEVNNELSEDEVNFINYLRQNGLTPEEFVNSLQGEPQEPNYKVDDYSDDELYIIDLENRVGKDLSDEEAAQALALAKQNEELFTKQVEGIRKEYKEREDYKAQQNQAELEEEQRQAMETYSNNVYEAVANLNSIGNFNLELDDEERNEIAEFLTGSDESGVNYMYQALQDPEALVKMAWFLLNGEQAFSDVTDYFTNQIKTISDSSYKKGLEDGKKNKSSKPTVVMKQPQNSRQAVINSADDLFDED